MALAARVEISRRCVDPYSDTDPSKQNECDQASGNKRGITPLLAPRYAASFLEMSRETDHLTILDAAGEWASSRTLQHRLGRILVLVVAGNERSLSVASAYRDHRQ